MIGQQALLQTLVQEVTVRLHHVIDCMDITTVEKAVLKLQKVGLKDFHRHIVDIVFAKVEHSVSKSEGMLLDT